MARANLIGAIWMIAAMAGFAVEDMFLKAASTTLPVSQVLILFGLGGAALFACVAVLRGHRLANPAVLARPMLIRAVFELFGRLFYVLALALAPLSSATAILQATPIVVVAGAALFFGETVGWRRWSAIIIGLFGVLIILQPGADSFTIYSVFAVLGMLGFAGRDLATRAASATLQTAVLGFYGFITVTIAGVGFALWEAPTFIVPDTQTTLAMSGAVFAGALAYSSLMLAMRTGQIATVTPFRYTRLLFGLGFGVVLFGETLTPATLLGCALVVASGLFIMWQGARRKSG